MRHLPSRQIPLLGLARFARALTLFEIHAFFTFDETELAAIRTRFSGRYIAARSDRGADGVSRR